jgi:hypothetical protein
MTLVIAVAVILAATLFYTLFVRAQDIPAPDPVSPTRYLDERKATIYENLRDLHFEYRVGKLSDADYAQTKLSLQKELAAVIAETDRMVKGLPAEPLKNAISTAPSAKSAAVGMSAPKKDSPSKLSANAFLCPHCGAKFPTPMKFCGICGKEMDAAALDENKEDIA